MLPAYKLIAIHTQDGPVKDRCNFMATHEGIFPYPLTPYFMCESGGIDRYYDILQGTMPAPSPPYLVNNHANIFTSDNTYYVIVVEIIKEYHTL